jgi:DNA transposition AAA+ family ATPase
MIDHFLGVEGVTIIATEQLLDTRDLVAELIEVHGMGAVYGPAGTGKTFAVTQALTDHRQRTWVRTAFRSRPTMRYVRHELYCKLGLGVAPPPSPVETDVLLKGALDEHVRLVVIDEAQWLNRECFEYLRYLHDDAATTFALLLVGGAGCYEVLRREPMLDSRLYAHLRFAPMTPEEVTAVIPVYHPIYQGVPASLITLVDEKCAHGNFRNWAKFTLHALRFVKTTGRERIDEEVARNVFARFGGGRNAA